MKPEARKVDVEVLPPDDPRGLDGGARADRGIDDPLIHFVARLMDSLFTVPGTRIKFGLDPLIGLIPALGSPISAFVSLFLLAQSARYKLPRVVLARMALNILINAALDAVPVVGDTISIFFRSNAMNYELLRKHAGKQGVSTKRDWLFIYALFGCLAFLLLAIFVGIAVMLADFARLASWAVHRAM